MYWVEHWCCQISSKLMFDFFHSLLFISGPSRLQAHGVVYPLNQEVGNFVLVAMTSLPPVKMATNFFNFPELFRGRLIVPFFFRFRGCREALGLDPEWMLEKSAGVCLKVPLTQSGTCLK